MKNKKFPATDSWFEGLCKECGSNVIICQSKNYDYFYYCSQKYCKNHEGIELYDMDEPPLWVDYNYIINDHYE